MVSNLFSKSDDYFSVGTGEGLGDDYSGGLLLFAFNSGKGLLNLGAFSNSIKVVSPGFVVVSFPECIPLIGDRCMEGRSRGWCWWGGRASSFRVGSRWFVGMGVSGLWAQFANFGSKLCDLFLKLGDAVGAGVLGGGKCSFHTVKAGKNLVHDVIIRLAEHCRLAEYGGAESILGESGVGAFARSRGAGREYSLLGVLLGTGGAFAGIECLFRGGRRS
jgi:hypothetical protein